jgi:cytidylate kinase
MENSLIITVDGPAAAGKGTIANALGHAFDMVVLDTGLLYRLVGLNCHRVGIDPHDHASATARAQELATVIVDDPSVLDHPDWRGREAGIYASVYSAIPGVRAALTEIQRNFAAHPPSARDGHHPIGAILDGRDCGTEIVPWAPLKFYITAHVDERAHRRHRDLVARGEDVAYTDVLQDLIARDHRDMTRATAPTRPADDAVMIDTTGRSIDDILVEVMDIAQNRLDLSPPTLEGEITKHPEERA